MGVPLTTQEVIRRCIITHGDYYSYERTNYTNTNIKIEIICHKHGSFWQSAYKHIAGQGCSDCAKERKSQYSKSTKEEFVTKANTVHNSKFDYSLVNYVNSETPVEIKCPIHGKFVQVPGSHLSGKGCKQCGIEAGSLARTKLLGQVLTEFRAMYGETYDYSLVDYKDTKTHVEILCKKHGPFFLTPDNHLQGNACPSCAKTGFDPDKPAILYYLSVNNGEAYKVGITNRTIQKRFAGDMQYISVLHQIHYESGHDAYKEEQKVLNKFKQHRYVGPDLLRNGNTELFSTNVLNL